tara:strand:- start:594 stop:1580 length:987 start_codon:yes stop_codon:yes gene_type:complete
MKTAIITGIYGQDGSILAEYLKSKEYKVVGLVSKVRENFLGLEFAEIIQVDITDSSELKKIFNSYNPDECYHLAAAHHSAEQKSDSEIHTDMLKVNFLSTKVMIDVILEVVPNCRFLYAGSSQMFSADADITIIDEKTPYNPSSFYGITKVASAQLISLMRRNNNFWGMTVILFNHESVKRTENFLSRKVTSAAAKFANETNQSQPAEINKLFLNDVCARVDWSAASDFIRAFHLSLQADDPSDLVLASGHVHSVSELLEEAFSAVDLDWTDYTETKNETNNTLKPCLQGNSIKAMKKLDWIPHKSFSDLIKEMVENDLKIIQSNKII